MINRSAPANNPPINLAKKLRNVLLSVFIEFRLIFFLKDLK